MQLHIRVVPRSKKNALKWQGNTLKAHLTAPPVDGAANAALILLLARELKVPKSTISIVRGETAREKTVEFTSLSREELLSRLQEVAD